ncbi:MAG: ArsR family transcriptional regulator [Gammaproteobacteria bacterium]|nr:MAG: ArsR family transcriptional regulator [Gammaproteobacteria bacterium]
MAKLETNINAQPEIEALFFALGEKQRRHIFFSLMDGEKTVKQLAEPLNITLTGLGQHIKILEAAKLVRTEKVGRERICSVNPEGLATMENFAKLHRNLWSSRFSALRKIVEAH